MTDNDPNAPPQWWSPPPPPPEVPAYGSQGNLVTPSGDSKPVTLYGDFAIHHNADGTNETYQKQK